MSKECQRWTVGLRGEERCARGQRSEPIEPSKSWPKGRRMAGLGPNPGYVSYKFSDSGQNT